LIVQRNQPLRPSLLLRAGMASPSSFGPAAQDEGELLTLEASEKKCIGQALRKYNGNYSQSAKALGTSLSTLKRKIKLYRL